VCISNLWTIFKPNNINKKKKYKKKCKLLFHRWFWTILSNLKTSYCYYEIISGIICISLRVPNIQMTILIYDIILGILSHKYNNQLTKNQRSRQYKSYVVCPHKYKNNWYKLPTFHTMYSKKLLHTKVQQNKMITTTTNQ
jgi:hypothetical protein